MTSPVNQSQSIDSSNQSSSQHSIFQFEPSIPTAAEFATSFPGIAPGSTIHSCLAALRSTGNAGAGCQPSISSVVDQATNQTIRQTTAGSDNNNHFHLHLHNYLSSHSNTVALSSRMVACDRAIESRRPANDRLFFDPLAVELAGPELMEKALRRHEEVLARHKVGGSQSSRSSKGDNDDDDDDDAPRSRRPSNEAGQPARRMGPETDPIKTPRVAIRTRFFDDFLQLITQSYPKHVNQLMLLACGMDTRAFRLDCLRTTDEICCRVYELDTAPILDYKNAIINTVAHEEYTKLKCHRRITVPVDISSMEGNTVQPMTVFEDDATRAANPISSTPAPTHQPEVHRSVSQGSAPTVNRFEEEKSSQFDLPVSDWCKTLLNSHHFQPRAPSVWILEGSLMYLTQEQQLRTLQDISCMSSIGSFFAFSHINEKALNNVQRSGAAWGVLNSTFRSCLDEEFLNAMVAFGWEVVKFTQIGAADANYGRWLAPVYPLDDPQHGVTLYVAAAKVRNVKIRDREYDQSIDAAVMSSLAHDNSDAASVVSPASARSLSDSDDESMISVGTVSDIASTTDESMLSTDDESGDSPILSPSITEREHAIDSWNARAVHYQELVRVYPIFTTFAHRLIDLIHVSSGASVGFTPLKIIDLAAGTGIVSTTLFTRYPFARVHLVEPAVSMLNLARVDIREKFGAERMLSCNMLRAEDCSVLATEFTFKPVDAILCSASMHLCQEELIFPQIVSLLKPGGCFVYNVYGHAWADCAGEAEEDNKVWQECVDAALMQFGEAPVYSKNDLLSSPPSRSVERSFDSINKLAIQHGLVVDECILDCDHVGAEYMIEYQSMNNGWLHKVSFVKRSQVIRRARELASQQMMRIQTIRVRVTKPLLQ